MALSDDDTGGYDSRAFVAEFYDFVPAIVDRADREFYLRYAREAGGTVVELGCGTGRLLIPIARSGVRITGVDLSHAMLERCREKLQREPSEVQERVTLVRCDFTQLDMPRRYSLALAPFRCLQHVLKVEQQMSCLQSVHHHLEPGGRLIVDMFQVSAARMHDPAFLQEQLEADGVRLPDGRTFRRSFRTSAFHRAEQINDCELIYDVTHPDGRSERLVHAFPLRYFFRYEVEHLLARCGFTTEHVFGDYDTSELCDDSPEMIFVARKNG